MFNLSHKRIVVTGGVGHLGRSICIALANCGAKVLSLSSRRDDHFEVKHPEGVVISNACELGHEGNVDDLIGKFATIRHGLDGLINCAARSPRGANLDMGREEFISGLDGLVHYFTTAKIALRYMEGAGSIVNVSSAWGLRSPTPDLYLDLGNDPAITVPVVAGGIQSMTRYLAVLLAERSIRVNSLIPGWFPQRRGKDRPDYIGGITSNIPLGRIGQPCDLSGAAVFLMADESRYMTGQQIVVDGGFTAH